MKAGRVKISPDLIVEGLKLPSDWRIESIEMKPGESSATAIISGSDFPEIENGEVKDCRITVHVEYRRHEVEAIS
ncbi:MAG: hypothetical protein A4E65_03703 [Syntrophorhabdus sp. PtaU1.Bin153]|nr:MAG: hypothetical protein A4E65_03703 [Syntrophorhabdus sp. PtaU1.Bin153]